MICRRCKRKLSETENDLQPSNKSMKYEESKMQSFVLQGTIPDVVQWVRNLMDSQLKEKGRNSNLVLLKKATARKISTRVNVRIDFDEGRHWWKGDFRFWENVCGFAAKLSEDNKGKNIFDAMRRYPSSVLVFNGLKTVFGRYMMVGTSRIRRLPRSKNAMSMFSPVGSCNEGARGWFELDAYGRLQEMVVHLTAVAEYVLRSVHNFYSQNTTTQGDWNRLSFVVDEHVVETALDHQTVLKLRNVVDVGDLAEYKACSCLYRAVAVAHSSVIEGAATAGRRLGKKRSNGLPRRRVHQCMLRRPLHEVLDTFVEKITDAVQEIVTDDLDASGFYLQMTKLLRKVERIYMEIGADSFQDTSDHQGPSLPPKGMYVFKALKK